MLLGLVVLIALAVLLTIGVLLWVGDERPAPHRRKGNK